MFSFREPLHEKINQQQQNMPSVGKSTERRVLAFLVRDNGSGLFTKGVQLGFKVRKQVTTLDPAITHLKIHSKETTRKVQEVI